MKRFFTLLLILSASFLSSYGVVHALSVFQVIQGGTGWGNIQSSAIPYGNGTGAISTTSVGTGGFILSYLNGIPKWAATTTFNSPLTYSGGSVSCSTCNTSAATVSSIATNNGLTGGTITTSGTIGLNTTSFSTNALITWDGSNLVATGTPQLTVGNLLATSTSATSTFAAAITVGAGQGTSTFAGGLSATKFKTTATSSMAGINLESGCFAINLTCISGAGGGVTSVGLSLPTGFTVTNSPVTTSGTLTGTLALGYSIKELPSYTVGASGADFTTIQGALNQCGTDGGGNIYLVDKTYAQAGTGLLWKGSDCNIYGRLGSTTITFTGATTLFKTNSAVGLYNNNGIHQVVITGDGTAGSVAIDMSDMSHSTYADINVDNVDTAVRVNDTQNITFYNKFERGSFTTLKSFGINASSTKPANDNTFEDLFIGCSNTTCTGINLNNDQANHFVDITMEPAGTAGTVGVQIRANSLANNNGTFSNEFHNVYIEGNSIGVAASSTVGSAVVFGNNFYGGQIETNTNNTLFSSADQFEASFYGVGLNFVNTNILGVTTIRSKSNGTIFSLQDDGFSNTAFSLNNNTNFAHNSTDYVKFSLLNSTDSSNLLNLSNTGTGATIIATSSTNFLLDSNGKIGVGTTTTSTVPGRISIATTTTAQLTLQGAAGQIPFSFRSIGNEFYIATSSATSQATSTVLDMKIDANGKVYFPSTAIQAAAATDYWCYDANAQLVRVSALCTTSALRYKKDVRNLNIGLDDLMLLRPVSYYRKDPLDAMDSHQQIGFIADEVASTSPELNETLVTYVGGGTSGMVQGFRYDQFTALITKSVQDLNRKVDATVGVAKRSAEENWQWLIIGLLSLGFIYQQMQIRKLKK